MGVPLFIIHSNRIVPNIIHPAIGVPPISGTPHMALATVPHLPTVPCGRPKHLRQLRGFRAASHASDSDGTCFSSGDFAMENDPCRMLNFKSSGFFTGKFSQKKGQIILRAGFTVSIQLLKDDFSGAIFTFPRLVVVKISWMCHPTSDRTRWTRFTRTPQMFTSRTWAVNCLKFGHRFRMWLSRMPNPMDGYNGWIVQWMDRMNDSE